MTWARRALDAFGWRHLAIAAAAGAAWTVVRRIGMVANNVDGFAADFWLYETLFNVLAAWTVAAALVLAETRAPSPRGPANAEYAGAVLLAALVFAAIAVFVLPPWPAPTANTEAGARYVAMVLRNGWSDHPVFVLLNCLRTFMFASFAAGLYVWLRRSRTAELALEAARLARTDAERRLAEAQLLAAHGSVEPDAVLRRLDAIESAFARDPQRADAMLDDLIQFLRAAVPRLREVTEEEVALEAPGGTG